MTKIKTLIIDDEPLAHEIILQYAEEVASIEIVGQCFTGTEALNFLRNENVDLLFLDIQMPKLKGTDFLRILTNKPIVIITSAFQEYALESFELDVCDYLLKPFRFDRFLKATDKAVNLYQLKNNTTLPVQEPDNEKNHLFIKADKKLIQLNTADIYYLESFGNYVKIWLNDHFHLTPGTLSGFESQLQTEVFIRVHKSFIIHKKYIDYLEGNTARLKNKISIPIGKQHRTKIKQILTNG